MMRRARELLRIALIVLCGVAIWGCETSSRGATTTAPKISRKQLRAEKKAQKKELDLAKKDLPELWKEFIEDVGPIITEKERISFLRLKSDNDRQEFVREFWKARPEGFRDTYYDRLREIKAARDRPIYDVFNPWRRAIGTRFVLEDNRNPAIIYLLNGPPYGSKQVECNNLTWPIQIWYYDFLPSIKRKDVVLVFYSTNNMDYRLWLPQDTLSVLLMRQQVVGSDRQEFSMCADWRDILEATTISTAQLDGPLAARTTEEMIAAPTVNTDGEERVMQMSTNVDEKASKLPLHFFDAYFTGTAGNINKTNIELSFSLPKESLTILELADQKSYNVDVVLQVRTKGYQAYLKSVDDKKEKDTKDWEELSKGFFGRRFHFDFFVNQGLGDVLPISLNEDLYPGEYEFILKFIDINDSSDHPRQVGWKKIFTVPYVAVRAVEKSTAVTTDPLTPSVASNKSTERVVSSVAGDASYQPVHPDPLSQSQMVILPPPQNPIIGVSPFEVHVTKDLLPFVSYVEFFVNTTKNQTFEKKNVTKHAPPFTVDLDMGRVPRAQTIRAVAYDRDHHKLCENEIGVNQGAHSLRVRLIAPTGSRANGETKIQAAVFVPDNHSVKRLDFFVNDSLVKTLTQESWITSAQIRGNELTSVRAVATLDTGLIAEDMRYVNLPGFISEVDVNVVELYVVVKDGKGIVENLKPENFSIREDNVPQKIEAFEYKKQSPITVGVVLDTSCSMEFSCFKDMLPPGYDVHLRERRLRDVQSAAIGFIDTVIRPQDRGFTMDFNAAPHILMPLTTEKQRLAFSLIGLRAEGETALYDTVMRSLYELQDVKGKKAIVLLSDGKDTKSNYDFETALEYARRAGVAVYTIGFNVSDQVRTQLIDFAKVSGGRVYFIKNIDELRTTYKEIEAELRSQYVITYYSKSGTREWRAIDVEVTPKNFKVRTIAGYFPE